MSFFEKKQLSLYVALVFGQESTIFVKIRPYLTSGMPEPPPGTSRIQKHRGCKCPGSKCPFFEKKQFLAYLALVFGRETTIFVKI